MCCIYCNCKIATDIIVCSGCYVCLGAFSNFKRTSTNISMCLWCCSNVARTLERVCIRTVEEGKMTKDLALLIGPDQAWQTTQEFLSSIDENLQKAMA